MAEREEGEERLVLAPAEVFLDDLRGPGDVGKQHAVVLAHPARGTARAAGVDNAGEVVALHRDQLRLDLGAGLERIAFQKGIPVVVGESTALHRVQRFHAHDVAAHVGLDDGRQQRLGQLGAGDDGGPCARIL